MIETVQDTLGEKNALCITLKITIPTVKQDGGVVTRAAIKVGYQFVPREVTNCFNWGENLQNKWSLFIIHVFHVNRT